MLTSQQLQQLKSVGTPQANTNFSDVDAAKAAFGSTSVNAPAADATPAGPGLMERMGSDFSAAGAKAKAAIEGTGENAGDTAVTRGFTAAKEIAGAPIAAATEVLPEGVRSAIGAVGEAGSGIVNWLGEKIGSTQVAQDWVKAHPDAASALEQVAKVGESSGAIAGDILGAEGGRLAGGKVVDATKAGVDAGKTVFNTGKTAMEQSRAAADAAKVAAQQGPDLLKINDMITPKPTAGQAKIAMDEGRLYKGKNPTLFGAGTPDKVAADAQQAQSAFTIKKLIPDAAKMDEPTLYTALGENETKLAQALEPKLKAAPLDEGVVQKLNDDWTNMKKEQISEAKATDEPNVVKWQSNFEKFLKKAGSDNMNDLWVAAKDYDRSIKANVKNATDLSPEDLQTQKEIWLQNRSILRSAIKDSTTKLGKESQQAFSDMSDLYEAQNGILSKAKIEKVGKPSQISEFMKTPAGKAVKTGAGIIVGDKVIKAATGFGI